jgi:hypothetical protein
MTASGTTSIPTCNYCGSWHTGICPRVAEIEYYEDGTVKRVKLHPVGIPAAPQPLPYVPYTPPPVWPKPGDTYPWPPVKITWSDGSAAAPANGAIRLYWPTN